MALPDTVNLFGRHLRLTYTRANVDYDAVVVCVRRRLLDSGEGGRYIAGWSVIVVHSNDPWWTVGKFIYMTSEFLNDAARVMTFTVT